MTWLHRKCQEIYKKILGSSGIGVRLTTVGPWRTFWSDGNGWYIEIDPDYGGDYTTICIRQNSQNCILLKKVNFIAYKLYPTFKKNLEYFEVGVCSTPKNLFILLWKLQSGVMKKRKAIPRSEYSSRPVSSPTFYPSLVSWNWMNKNRNCCWLLDHIRTALRP